MTYQRKSRKSREMHSLYCDLSISFFRGKFGRYPSNAFEDPKHNNGWVLGLDIMYLFFTSPLEHRELRCQVIPHFLETHFRETISLDVLHFLTLFNGILQSKDPALQNLYEELESYTPYFDDWFNKIHKEIWDDIEKRLGQKVVQKYKSGSGSGSSFVELLRFVRNTWAHITELKVSVEILKRNPYSFYSYIDARFPVFLMIAYRVAYKFCREEQWFQEFLRYDDICSRIRDRKFFPTYFHVRLKSLLMMARKVTK